MNVNKKKMLKIMYVYIAIILLLVFFSKSIYNFSLPKVSVSMPKSGKLTKELELFGVVSFSETYDIYSFMDGQVDEIYVAKGDSVEIDTTVAQYKKLKSTSEIEIIKLGFTIGRIENQIDSLELDKKALHAEIQYLDIESEISEIDSSLVLELKEIERLISVQEVEIQKTKILYDVGSLSKADHDNEIEKLNTLKSSKIQKENQIENQEKEREANYHEDEKKRLGLLNQKSTDLVKIDLDLDKCNIDMQEAKSTLEMLRNDGYKELTIRSRVSGTIISIYKQKDSFISTGEKIVTVGANNNSFVSEVTCAKSEGKFINIGDEANILLEGTDIQAKATVHDVQPEEDRLKIKLIFQSEQFKGGEYVSVRFHKQTKTYDVLVPNEAIVNEGFNNYVWVIRSKSGSLGTEYYSVKIRVMIADSDFGYTAISKGIEYLEPVVIGKDKELMMNSRVNQMD